MARATPPPPTSGENLRKVLKAYCGDAAANWKELGDLTAIPDLEQRAKEGKAFSSPETSSLQRAMDVSPDVIHGQVSMLGKSATQTHILVPSFMVRGDAVKGQTLKGLLRQWPGETEPAVLLARFLPQEVHSTRQAEDIFNGAKPLSWLGLTKVLAVFSEKSDRVLNITDVMQENWRAPFLHFNEDDDAPPLGDTPPPAKDEGETAPPELPDIADVELLIDKAVELGLLERHDNRLLHPSLFHNLKQVMPTDQLAAELGSRLNTTPRAMSIRLSSMYGAHSTSPSFLADILSVVKVPLKDLIVSKEAFSARLAELASAEALLADDTAEIGSEVVQPPADAAPAAEAGAEQAPVEATEAEPTEEETPAEAAPAAADQPPAEGEADVVEAEAVEEQVPEQAPAAPSHTEDPAAAAPPEDVTPPAPPAPTGTEAAGQPVQEPPVAASPTTQERAAISAAYEQIEAAIAAGGLILHKHSNGSTVESPKLTEFWFNHIGKEEGKIRLVDLTKNVSHLVGEAEKSLTRAHWTMKDNGRLRLSLLAGAMVDRGWSLDSILGVTLPATKPARAKKPSARAIKDLTEATPPAAALSTEPFYGLSSSEVGGLQLVLSGYAEKASPEMARALVECVPLPPDLTDVLACGLSQLAAAERPAAIHKLLGVMLQAPPAA